MAGLTRVEKEIRDLVKQSGFIYKISASDVKIIKHKLELLKILRKDPDNLKYISLTHKGTILSDDRTIELGEIDTDDIQWKFTGRWSYGNKYYK